MSDWVDEYEAAIEEQNMEALRILEQVPQEADHAKALQAGIEYYERLNRLHLGAIAGRNGALAQIEFYREGLGRVLRRASDEIIDGDFKETGHALALIGKPDDIARSATDDREETPSIANTDDNGNHASDETGHGELREAHQEAPSIASADDNGNQASDHAGHGELKEPHQEAPSTTSPDDNGNQGSDQTGHGELKEAHQEAPSIASPDDNGNHASDQTSHGEAPSIAGAGGDAS
jgi:hypothetical protein